MVSILFNEKAEIFLEEDYNSHSNGDYIVQLSLSICV